MNKKLQKEIESHQTTLRSAATALENAGDGDTVSRELNPKVADVKEAVENLRDEWQGKYDDMSEKRQEGEKGQELYDNIAVLDDAVSTLEEAVGALEEEENKDRDFSSIATQLNEAADKLDELQ